MFDLESTCEDAGIRIHLDLIVAAANLRASMYGSKGQTDDEYIHEVPKNDIKPNFTPTDGVRIAVNDRGKRRG